MRPLKIPAKWLPFALSLLLSLPLFCRPIETFYGPIEVNEPVLLELIDHPMFQRLKHIHQYGVAYYISHKEEYNRFDHSVGVFTILRMKGASLEEQIAGLLHDASHTVFSHVGDWLFGKENQEKGYQDVIHGDFLEKSGLADIVQKYGFNPKDLIPSKKRFPALECPLPDLCADRIDYNIQGAYYQNFISHEEALALFDSLTFVDDRWISSRPDLIKKITRFSLFMTENCWGSPLNYATSRWLADALLEAMKIGTISHDDIHFSTDHAIWSKLLEEKTPLIEEKMQMLLNAESHLAFTDESEADFVIRSKFRGINPLIKIGEKTERILSLDAALAKEYETSKETVEKGWRLNITRSLGTATGNCAAN